MRRVVLTGVMAALAMGAMGAQVVNPKNPSGLAFTCPDHATDTDHEVAIIKDSDGSIVQTIVAGDPAPVNGEVIVPINVQPTAFGKYRFKVRAGGPSADGIVWSEWSDPSAVWERVPGKPGGLVVR